jgi:hypothetical protein
MTMRVAYLTTDEVNEAEARQLAEDHDITLCPLAPRDGPPGNEYDAVLYDWDFWPADRRREAMAELLGYNLNEDAAERLPAFLPADA